MVFLGTRSLRKAEMEEGRVYLRRPVMADFKKWAELRAASAAFLKPWEPTWPSDSLSKAAFRRRLRYYAADRRRGIAFSYFIFAKADDALLGGITLSHVRRGVAQSGNLGYWMGLPHARQGYMTEALEAVVRHAFGPLRLHRLEAATLPENDASRRLLGKVGFKEEGFAPAYLQIAGDWRDHVLFGLVNPAD